ncbi:MAG TPA: aconitate hydratase AcnA [Polyangiales bacterium]|nr:aconitate hydratase AcnA [Polyangiales bacterium]
MTTYLDSFQSKGNLNVGGRDYEIYRLSALTKAGLDISRLPVSLRVLLENLLRNEDGKNVSKEDITAAAKWDPKAKPSSEIAYMPARVLLQDFTGVPCVVDLAAMREAMKAIGGDPNKINPLQPADLVIDHSVQVDTFGTLRSLHENMELEFQRNQERYQFLKWGQTAFKGFRVVPPGTGIVHQVNLEYLAQVVFIGERDGKKLAYPDTLVGTDSHTTMVNGLGVLGWGVGGIEAEAAMLGQSVAMLVPEVIGFKLTGKLREGVTATDLVLTVVQMLRKKGVVDKFVEFYGDGLDSLPLPDRATIANMAPEYGATMGFFPVDKEVLAYLRFTGRSPEQVALVEAYSKEQGLFRVSGQADPMFTDTLALDLGDVEASLAGPKRPQDRVPLRVSKDEWGKSLTGLLGDKGKPDASADVAADGGKYTLKHGDVVISAITSCTNTSNPAVLVAAGLLAKRAIAKGLQRKPWVKTSLAPGSQVVTDYLTAAGLLEPLEKLGFNLVGYGCTTCIGNSGPLPDEVSAAIKDADLVAVSVLSGNRNFEGRVHPQVRANYLASPPLVVAYALAGTMNIDLDKDPIGSGKDGKPVFLKDLWPSQKEISETIGGALQSEMFVKRYSKVSEGPEEWRKVVAPSGDTFAWDPKSTYIRKPTFFEGLKRGKPEAPKDIVSARVLALLGDSVTTDHISPAGNIAKNSPAAKYLEDNGVSARDYNQYGARRGNHEVMVRGTFANIRLQNLLVPGVQGGVTRHLPDGTQMSIYDAAQKYKSENVPLVVIGGKEYGTGSSRDWAAKGTNLLGVRAVITESYERIHRSNLIGMGVLPLEFLPGQSQKTLNLTGEEVLTITGISEGLAPRKTLKVKAGAKEFEVVARLDTQQEVEYYLHGGILPYVLRQLAES